MNANRLANYLTQEALDAGNEESREDKYPGAFYSLFSKLWAVLIVLEHNYPDEYKYIEKRMTEE